MKFSLRTLERWVARYETKKLIGLKRKARGDKGKTRSLTAAALERVTQLRKEEPSRSTPTLIDIAEREGTVSVGALKRSTVDRHLDKGGASRRLMQVLGAKRHVRLAFAHPMDFVVGDFHAGPYVRTETGEIRRTELEAFVDHTSRFLPESRYGLTEDMMAVRKAMRGLCTAWGFDGRRIQRAAPQVKGEAPVDGPVQSPRPPPTVDYLALLQKSHERRRAEALSTIRFRAVHDVSAQLTLSRLLEQLRTCSGRVLGEVERQHATEVLHSLAPLEIAIADAAFRAAVTTLGHGLHAAQYLAALREAVLHARRKANP